MHSTPAIPSAQTLRCPAGRGLPRLAAALAGVALAALCLVACGGGEPPAPRVEVGEPPATEVRPVVDTLHGREITDPYRWLEDQEAPETRQWIEAQNTYTDDILQQLPHRDTLEQWLTRLNRVESLSFPTQRGDLYFFSQRKADQDLSVIYVRQGVDGDNRVLVDPHGWTEDHSKSATLLDVSRDGSVLAYGVREGGQDEIEARFLQVASGEHLPVELPKARYFGFSLTPDASAVYYTRYDEAGPRVFRRALQEGAQAEEMFGDGYASDKLIFGALSEDGRWMTYNVAHGAAGDRSEVFVQNVAEDGPVRTVVDDLEARTFGSVTDGRLILQSNWQAPNGRVFTADPADPGRDGWREIIPTREEAVIRSTSTAAGRLWVSYLQDVQSRVESFDLQGESLGTLEFDTIGTVSNVGGSWSSDQAFFVFTSFHMPTTVYRYLPASDERHVWDRVEVPIEVDTMEVSQKFFESEDGTRVPMFLVHRKGLETTGDHPTLLTGYGGFNVSLTPSFNSLAALWVQSGGVWAVANLRGGGEYGEEWHRAGMLENKQNTFDDFIAAAEWLIDNGYTNPDRLAIRGGSNGGLLVGAAMTQRPELFEAVVCSVPLLDMVRFHQFMVAEFWVSEYGSAEDPEQFETLLAYSPYHNVQEGTEYPATLFLTGDGDTRVAPLHARKMTALVQANNASDEPILLRYHTKAGHSGGRPVSEEIVDDTELMSFLFWQLDMDPPPAPPQVEGVGERG